IAAFFGDPDGISLLDILGGSRASYDQFVNRLGAVAGLGGSLGGLAIGPNPVLIDLGSWQVDVSGKSPVVTRTQTTNIYDQLNAGGHADLASGLQRLGVGADGSSGPSASGVHPALLNPGNVVNLFLGQPYQILTFDPLAMQVAAGFDFGFNFGF